MPPRVLLSFEKPDSAAVPLRAARPGAVRDSALFRGLGEAEKDDLLHAGRVMTFSRQGVIFRQGDAVRGFYLVCGGIVQLFRQTPDGREITTDLRVSGDPLAEAENLEPAGVHPVSALAVNDAQVMAFPARWLQDSARKNSLFSLNLLALLAARAEAATVEAEHQATFGAAQLVACFLQKLCVLHGFDPAGFDLPFAKSLVASRLGMELETLSRTLPKLRENGIAVDGRRVALSSLPAIESHACAHCSVMESCPAYRALRQPGYPRADFLPTH